MERYQQDYDVNLEYAFMYKSEHGPYVLYEEHVADAERREALHLAVVQKLEDRIALLEQSLESADGELPVSYGRYVRWEDFDDVTQKLLQEIDTLEDELRGKDMSYSYGYDDGYSDAMSEME